MRPVGLEGLYTFHDSKYNDGTDDIVVDELHHGLQNLKKQPRKSCLRTPPRSAGVDGENGGGGGGGGASSPERPTTPSGLAAMTEGSPSRGGEEGLSVRFKEELTEPAYKAYFRQRAEEEQARAQVEESPSSKTGQKGSDGWVKDKRVEAKREEPYPRAG